MRGRDISEHRSQVKGGRKPRLDAEGADNEKKIK